MAYRSSLKIYHECCRSFSTPTSLRFSQNRLFSSDFSTVFRQMRIHNNQIRNYETCQSWQLRLRKAHSYINDKLTSVSLLFAQQLKGITVQRIRRSFQISNMYAMMGYDATAFQKALQDYGKRMLASGKSKPFGLLCSAALFNWDKERIDEKEVGRVENQFEDIKRGEHDGETVITDPEHPGEWEKIIDRERITMWRRPISSYLYEYKVYGTFTDISAKGFYNAQIDFDFRKSWDNLIVKLDVIDKDPVSETEVVQWITHFPYPMYKREYVYLRKTKIDKTRNLMMIISKATDHPTCPRQENKFVRVDTFLSTLVLKPHKSFDDNGFDYVLTYHDDPKSNFPSVAYNWMATTGVPDFVDKLHDSAVRLVERKKGVRPTEESRDENAKSLKNAQ